MFVFFRRRYWLKGWKKYSNEIWAQFFFSDLHVYMAEGYESNNGENKYSYYYFEQFFELLSILFWCFCKKW